VRKFAEQFAWETKIKTIGEGKAGAGDYEHDPLKQRIKRTDE
jgi:hypothetical protein